MSAELTDRDRIRLVLKDKPYLPVLLVSAFSLVCAVLIWFGTYKNLGIYILPVIIAIPMVLAFIRYPRLWLYVVVISTIFYFRDSSDDISATDVIIALLYYGTLIPWLFWQVLIKRQKIVQCLGDWFVIAYYILMLLNSFIAVLNGVSLLDWFREYLIMSAILFYFPLIRYFNEKKYLIRLLIVFSVVTLGIDLFQFYDYYRIAMQNLIYAYQMQSSTRINLTFYTVASAVGVIFALFQKKITYQFLLVLLVALTVGALGITFARTFWLILFIEIVVIFIFVGKKQKFRLSVYITLISIIFTVGLFSVFKDNTTILLNLMEKRIVSSTEGTADISIVARLYEYEKVWEKIYENPLGGNGLAKKFHFYNPIYEYTQYTHYTHNGYFFMFYKAGLPLSFFFLFPLIYFIFISFNLTRKIKDNFYRMIALSALVIIITLIVANFSSTQFISRDGPFVLAYGYAFAGIALMFYKKELAENNHVIHNSVQEK